MGLGSSSTQIDKIAEEEISQVWGFVSNRLFDEKKNTKQKLTA